MIFSVYISTGCYHELVIWICFFFVRCMTLVIIIITNIVCLLPAESLRILLKNGSMQ